MSVISSGVSDANVLFERHGKIALITLNRPGRRNAVDARTSQELRECVDELENDASLSVGILRGNGSVFCSGMDLQAFNEGEAKAILFGEGGFAGFVRRPRSKPIIASVHGAALAGGFELLLACDLVVASDKCVFGLPEVKRGLLAGGGGALRLAQLLPRAVANEILLLGEPFDAKTAKRLGLINRVVREPELQLAAVELAEAIARNAPLSTLANLTVVNTVSQQRGVNHWALNDALLQTLINSDDAREGTVAFTEKREAVWRSR